MSPKDECFKWENISPGVTVRIRRTDGRVHTALISTISKVYDSVTVEWFERGETKGKEIELDTILTLNPELIVKKECKSFVKQQNTSSSKDYNCDYQLSSRQKNMKIPHNNKHTRNLEARLTEVFARIETDCKDPKKMKPDGREVTDSMSARRTNLTCTSLTSAATITPMGSAKSRRSSTVKEVERLKRNREERRQRQAEEKAEKVAIMNQSPGNPHWEFLNMVMEYQRSIDFKPITVHDTIQNHQITVCVRKRPLNTKEVARKEVDVISIPTKDTIIVHEPKHKVDLTKYLENQMFRFDYVFDDTCTNELVYKFTAQPLITTIFDGGMATCFAYGQTGSGKTHTMGGDFHGKVQDCFKGIYALVTKDVFQYQQSKKYGPGNYTVACSFFEIYSGKVFDLLNKKERLNILEDGKQQVQVVGLTEKIVTSFDDVIKIIQSGNNSRTSGQTSANNNSSRSHAVFQITLRPVGTAKVHGKFSLIDLAGNERGSDTSSASRSTRMEGAEINKSLLALKECIRALGKKNHGHLPFRASKLTQVLRDSFIGEKSKTCMIAMISPNVASCEHSLNTLRYADRVKELSIDDPKSVDFNQKYGSHVQVCDMQTMHDCELTGDMISFHKVVTDLLTLEEVMVENHKNLNEFLEMMLLQSKKLYGNANTVEYDQDEYSQEWQTLLDKAVDKIKASSNIIKEFRVKLNAEEQLSKSIYPK